MVSIEKSTLRHCGALNRGQRCDSALQLTQKYIQCRLLGHIAQRTAESEDGYPASVESSVDRDQVPQAKQEACPRHHETEGERHLDTYEKAAHPKPVRGGVWSA